MAVDEQGRSTKSGAARRREKKAEEREKKAEREALEGENPAWAEEFRQAGKPDLENPDTDLDYVRRLQLVALRQMATTPFPTAAQTQCWQRIKDMSATVGMTSNRAALEAKVKRLEGQLKSRREAGGAAKVVKGSEVQRPETARGGRTGPRSVAPAEPPSQDPDPDEK